ncbi:MAG: NAD-dependent epimerase/dehydratase family protein [Planctomycetota bacterium]
MNSAPLDVAVTGASGALGQHVVQALLAAGHGVRALVRAHDERAAWLEQAGASVHVADLFDERALHRAVRGATGLVHCAARESTARRDADAMRRLLVEGTSAALRVARRRGVERIVHVSSMVAVGMRRDDRPMNEETPWRGSDLPHVAAVHARREAEERVLTAARAGLPVVVVNPDATVGARADGTEEETLRAGATGPLPRRGASVARIEDVASGVGLALLRGVAGERYILGGDNLSLVDVARRIAMNAGRPAPPVGPPGVWRLPALALARLADRPPADVVRMTGWNTYADSTRAREELGYETRTESGIR